MTVTTTFRHIDATDSLKSHANLKVGRLQKFLRQPMVAKVTLSNEKMENVAEVQVQSGGEWYEAKEACEDMYAAIDLAVHKIERQISHAKGVESTRRRREQDLRHLESDDTLLRSGTDGAE